MQQILLAMLRSLLTGFHYTEEKDCTSWEKLPIQLTSKEVAKEIDLLLAGPHSLLFKLAFHRHY